MLTQLQKLLKQNESEGDFTHVYVTEAMLCEAERKIGVKIPAQYKWFLKEFGHGGFGGFEVLGFGKNGTVVFANETRKYRTYGLPKTFIMIENCDEWIYCIDSISEKVVMWQRDGADGAEAFDSFYSYLLDRYHDALENMAGRI